MEKHSSVTGPDDSELLVRKKGKKKKQGTIC